MYAPKRSQKPPAKATVCTDSLSPREAKTANVHPSDTQQHHSLALEGREQQPSKGPEGQRTEQGLQGNPEPQGKWIHRCTVSGHTSSQAPATR